MKQKHLFSLLAGLFISVALLSGCKKDKEEKPLIIKQGDYAPPAWLIGEFFTRGYVDDTTKNQFVIHRIDDSCCWTTSVYKRNRQGVVVLDSNPYTLNRLVHNLAAFAKWTAGYPAQQEITSNSYTISEYEWRYLKPDFYIHIEKVPSDDPDKPHLKVWYSSKNSDATMYYRYR